MHDCLLWARAPVGRGVNPLRKLTLGTLLTFATVFIGAAFFQLNPAARISIQNEIFDQYQRFYPRAYATAPVRIVAIDEQSLQRIGQWPWPRTVIAELVRKLQDAGATAIGFGIVFAEADRTSPRSMVNIWKSTGTVRDQLLAVADHDQVMAQALQRGKVVLGFASRGNVTLPGAPSATAAESNSARHMPKRLFGLASAGESALPYLHGFTETVSALELLENAAAGNGSLAYQPDRDGVVRRVPLMVKVENQVMPSLIAETLRVGLQQGNYTVTSGSRGIQDIRIGNVTVPTNAQGELWLHYTRPVAERYIPAWQILDGSIAPDRVAGSMALVGVSAQGLGEMHFNPLGDHTPAIEVLAQALEQITTGKPLSRPPWAAGYEMLALLAGGVLIGMVALGARALLSAAVTAIVLTSLWVAGWYAFTRHGLLLDPVTPSLILIITFVTGSVARHVASEREQRWVREAFSRYVSPSVVNQLIATPETLRLGGERRDITILFSDLAGFTTIAESLESVQVAAIVNRHLSEVTDAIQRHGGTVDKFIGDGVMAFWGAPIADEAQSLHAVQAALDMQRDLAKMRDEIQREAGVELRMRIGINRGDCIVGNMGGKNHFNYTLMGDAVNVASRIEGVNKIYGTGILVSDAVARAAGSAIRFREVDTVRVKGKQSGTTILTPCDDEALNRMTADALAAYRGGNWAEAGALWRALAARYPEDAVANVFLARIGRLASAPVAVWDGVTTLEEK